MKTFSLVLAVLLIVTLLPSHRAETPVQQTLEGTWQQVDQYVYDGEKVVDTIDRTKGYRQIKMFYDGKVMWSRFVPQDSVEWFGYGLYTTTDSTLTETLEYGSASMMKIIDSLRVFKMKLILKENWYSQIHLDGNGNPLFSENYKRIQ